MLGAERVILEVALHSRQFGFEPVVGVLHDVGVEEPALIAAARKHGVETAVFPARRRLDLATVRLLASFARSTSVDIIHSHGYRENFHALLAAPRVPRMATNHLWKLTSPKLRLYATIDSCVMRFFPYVTAVSSDIARDMVRRGLARERVTVIPNGISPVHARDRRPRLVVDDSPCGERTLSVTMVSSLTPEKRHSVALEAVAEAVERGTRLKLIIAGDGPEREVLTLAAERLGIQQHVTFLGWVTKVPELLGETDIFLITSSQEGLPMALLEAMNACCACVATAVGEIPEVLGSDAGIVVPVDDSVSVAKALSWLASQPEQRHALGRRAMERVATQYTSARMSEAYCDLYRRMLL